MITTAILDNHSRVDVLGIDGANAVILTKDGEDMEVSEVALMEAKFQKRLTVAQK